MNPGTLPVYPRVTGFEDNPAPKVTIQDPRPNLSILQAHGVKTLFHFTDAANLASIRANGLMSASNLLESKINSRMNSDQLSRHLDKSLGLENYVRLSFNDKNPMMFVALKQERVSDLVVLQIKLEVVSRPNVLFTDCNATRRGAKKSSSPEVVRFDVVKAKDQFAVPTELKHFYQAEVLVPSPIPPNLILFNDPDSVDCLIAADDVPHCPDPISVRADPVSACPAPVSACPAPVSTCPTPVAMMSLQMKKYDDLSLFRRLCRGNEEITCRYCSGRESEADEVNERAKNCK